METHEDMVCLHGEGTYVTATGIACARCGEMLCRHDEIYDDRPDEWLENDWNGWPKDTPT